QHFFVEVKVIGRAAGRDRSDELGDLALNQLAIPAVAGALDGDVEHFDVCRGGFSRPTTVGLHTQYGSILNPHLRTGREVDALVLLEDVEHLIRRAAHGRRPFDHAQGNRLAAQDFSAAELVERGDDRHALDYAVKAVRELRTANMESKLNQDYIRYEQVEKRQSYHLAEDPREEFDDAFQIRTCDMRSPSFARELGEALHEIGFAILTGHGIDPALYDEAEQKIVAMFERLSLDEKLRFRAQRHGSVNQGYFPIHETSMQHPDWVEGWVFCRRAFERPAEFWPQPQYA